MRLLALPAELYPRVVAPLISDESYYSKQKEVCQHFPAKKYHIFSLRHTISQKRC